MILSDISITRPVLAWMMMIALILFGAICFDRMGVSLMPDVDFPVVSITTTYSGASPEIMETDIVDFIEDAVSGVEGVKNITSTVREGAATVTVELDLSQNIDVALQEIQSKVSQAQRQLPKDMDPPIISKSNPEDQPILWLALTADPDVPIRDAMAYVHDILKDQFSTVSGVGNIALGGYVDPNLRVWVRKGDLTQYNLTAMDVMATVQNEHVELPAGYVDDKNVEHTVRTLGESKTGKDFEKIQVNSRGGGPNYAPIPIVRIADIEDNLADIQNISRANGYSAVGLGIVKQRGTNAVEVAHAVRAKMKAISSQLPKGMHISVRVDSTTYIEDSVNELKMTLLLSAILTGLVCWMFLGSWSSAVNVWLAIPTSIVGTFMVTYFMGFTLNTFTLLALSLAIGIVVDDAIIVLENIVRHQEQGEGRIKAALSGAREITFAATAASLAVVAIFLPVAFMSGIMGKYFFQFGITIGAAVLLSLFEAITLTPMRASQFVVATKRDNPFTKFMDNGFATLRVHYKIILKWALEHRAIVIWGSLAFFLLTFSVGRILRTEFVPPQDQSLYMVRLQGPAWSSLDYMDQLTKQVETILSNRKEVEGYFSAIGGYSGGQHNRAFVFVSLKDKGKRGADPVLHREASQFDSMKLVREQALKVPDLQVYVQDLSLRGFSASAGFPIEVTIKGPNWDKLGALTQQMLDEVNKTGLMTDTGTNYITGLEEYDIVPDRKLAAEHGVSVNDIAQTISVLVGGLKAGTFERGGHRYDITVKMVGKNQTRSQILENTFIRNNRGELIPIQAVTHLVELPASQVIYRDNRERSTQIFGNPAKDVSQSTILPKITEIAKRILPDGYHIAFTGNTQASQESFSSLLFALMLGIIVSYMILGSQFNSFIDPVIVLLALPFSFSGGFIALYIAGQSLNIYSMIGFILLMGIVKKNSILLVDFTNQMREKGMGINEALLEACPIRLRPILMTSIATIVGAIPPALAWGPGAETRSPMAVAVIGGLFVSTLLTLFVIPCVYSLIGHKHQETIKIEEELL